MLDAILKQGAAVLVIFLFYTTYRFIRNETRGKVKNEDIKVKYLESKFSKGGKIRIVKPYTKNSTWRVYGGSYGTENGIYSVLDSDLEKLEEYKNYTL